MQESANKQSELGTSETNQTKLAEVYTSHDPGAVSIRVYTTGGSHRGTIEVAACYIKKKGLRKGMR
jgi:hypothetical protein